MGGATFRHESAGEYFKEMVECALDHQSIQAGELTRWYLVNLLSSCVRVGPAGATMLSEEPLALHLGRALASGGTQQREGLRRIGDASLLISGYFSDSLRRKIVDVDYYMALGGYAYGALGRLDEEQLGGLFVELAERFGEFADVLAEISERAGLTSNTDLLRLYEKWVRTGSRRNGQLLAERGIVPNAAAASRFMQ